MDYAAALLAVIAAPNAAAKGAILAELSPPAGPTSWPLPPLPPRPGRDGHYREGGAPPRRRRTLAHAGTRNRFLLAIHHIELSAVDLAALACLRGSGLPETFHRDFLAIARDEARHAGLLDDLLASRGLRPGAEPIHHRLWEAALACADLGEHLVVVPRFLEARGLDVSAELLPRLAVLDAEAHRVIAVIYQDEIGHVAIGTVWHRWWCQERAFEPATHFADVVRRRFPGQFPGPTPIDHQGRLQAGFTAEELALFQAPGV